MPITDADLPQRGNPSFLSDRLLEDRFARPDGTLDEERFSRFFRDYLMSKPDSGYVPLKETFPSFESHYAATGFSPSELAGALTRSAEHYAIISGREADGNTYVTQALAGLNQLESSTTYPLLLALFARHTSGEVDAEQLACAIRMLCGFIFRRFICGESSRGYGRMFVCAVGKEGDDPFKVLETYLLDRGWPDDRRFEAAFVEFPLYQRGYTREVLVTLERNRGHKEPADLKDAEVEHIMPQSLSETWREALGTDAERIHIDWLHRPGNLTLSAYNKELWNHPFAMKRARYGESNIVLTRELASYERWTEAEIRERGCQLAREAAQIWIGPKGQVARAKPDSGDDDEASTGQESSDTHQLQQEFWFDFMQRLRAQSKSIKPRAALPQYWIDFAIGRTNFTLQAFMSVRQHSVGVSLVMLGPNKQAHYHQLHALKGEIETEIGETLMWHELPHKKSSYISLYLRNSDPNDRAQWPGQHQWMIDRLEALHRCFSGRVKNLSATGEPAAEPPP